MILATFFSPLFSARRLTQLRKSCHFFFRSPARRVRARPLPVRQCKTLRPRTQRAHARSKSATANLLPPFFFGSRLTDLVSTNFWKLFFKFCSESFRNFASLARWSQHAARNAKRFNAPDPSLLRFVVFHIRKPTKSMRPFSP